VVVVVVGHCWGSLVALLSGGIVVSFGKGVGRTGGTLRDEVVYPATL